MDLIDLSGVERLEMKRAMLYHNHRNLFAMVFDDRAYAKEVEQWSVVTIKKIRLITMNDSIYTLFALTLNIILISSRL